MHVLPTSAWSQDDELSNNNCTVISQGKGSQSLIQILQQAITFSINWWMENTNYSNFKLAIAYFHRVSQIQC